MNPVRKFACGVLFLLIVGLAGCSDDDHPHYLPAYTYYSSPSPPVRVVSYPSYYGYSPYYGYTSYVPIRAYTYGYYDYCYPYYSNPYYGISLSAYVSCRQGYTVAYGYSCYFPATYGYYAVASRYVDLAYYDLSTSNWRAFDEHIHSAEGALPAGHHSLDSLEKIRQNASYESVDTNSVVKSLAEVQGDWSTKLARAATAEK